MTIFRNVDLVKKSLNPKLDISTIVLVMYDARTKLAGQVVDEVRAHFGERVCKIVIPRVVRLSEAPSFGQPITTFDPENRGAVAYRDLALEVLARDVDFDQSTGQTATNVDSSEAPSVSLRPSALPNSRPVQPLPPPPRVRSGVNPDGPGRPNNVFQREEEGGQS